MNWAIMASSRLRVIIYQNDRSWRISLATVELEVNLYNWCNNNRLMFLNWSFFNVWFIRFNIQHSTHLILIMPYKCVWNFNIQHTSYSLCQYACVLNFNIQHTLYSLCRKSKNELGISYLTLNQKIDVNSSKSLNIFVSGLLSENMLHFVNKKSYYCKLLFFLILGKTAT